MSAALTMAKDDYTAADGRLRPERVRADFPILDREVHGRPLVYLDSAASSQQPRAVLDAVTRYGAMHHANVHRGVHTLSQEATAAFEGARETVRRFINARSTREIIFTRGTTEAINLVAQSWGGTHLAAGDEVLVTQLEHHANIVPWQMACARIGAKLVALAHVSNALGTVLPVKRMIALAHERGVPVLIDGAQAVAHQRVDVQQLDCDFYVFSGHKVYAPTGIGVLYGREGLLDAMPPWQGGGDMILTVAIERSTYNELPWKFEAGTPNISGAVGLAAALDYLEMLGRDRVAAQEQRLLSAATERLRALPNLKLIGTAADKTGVISFTLDRIHPHDIGTILDREGVAIRTGHHCAMPVMTWYGLAATARASFGCYNTEGDIDRLVAALERVREVFA